MLYETRYIGLRQELVQARLRAGLTRSQVAQLLHKVQSFGSKVATGERYLDVIDFLAWCDATDASAAEVISRVQSANLQHP